MLDVEAVNLTQGLVLLSDGSTLPITNRFVNGEEVSDADGRAITAVVAGPDTAGKWWTVDMGDFDTVTRH